jgi:hypothetical protein
VVVKVLKDFKWKYETKEHWKHCYKLFPSAGRRNAAPGQQAYIAVSSTYQALGWIIPMHSYQWGWQPCNSYHTTQHIL